MNEIICGNCLEILPTIPTYSVDLVFTDPPYNRNKKYDNYSDNLSPEEYQVFVETFLNECRRISNNRLAIFVGSRLIKQYWDLIPDAKLVVVRKGAIGTPFKDYYYQFFGLLVNVRPNSQVYDLWTDIRMPGEGYYYREERYPNPGQTSLALTERVISHYSYQGDVILDPFMGCYDELTDVLTRAGWKRFADVTLGDEILTRDLSGNLLYHNPTNMVQYMYQGKMIEIKNRSTDLLVTPDHNMYVLTHSDFCKSRPPRFIRADVLEKELYRIPCGGTYQAEHPMLESTMYLLGLYVSEGYIEYHKGNYYIVVCQNKGAKHEAMLNKLKGLDVRNRGERKFNIKIAKEFKDFIEDNCGKGASNKFLSPLILSSEHLQSLFDGMIIGDGNVSNGQTMYYTTSERLSGNFQELCIKLGYNTTIGSRLPRSGKIESKAICYVITVRHSKNNSVRTRQHISVVSYSGMVYCLTVPNHTMFVRRNGKTAWCGNCGTTAVAAKKLDRQYMGCELSQKYCDIAEERLRQTNAVQLLFESQHEQMQLFEKGGLNNVRTTMRR